MVIAVINKIKTPTIIVRVFYFVAELYFYYNREDHPDVKSGQVGLNFYHHRQYHGPFLGLGKQELANIIADLVADVVGIGPRERVGVDD